MTAVDLLAAHPYLAGVALVTGAWLAERTLLILAGSIAVAIHGPYLRRTASVVNGFGFFVVAFLLMCAPVVVMKFL